MAKRETGFQWLQRHVDHQGDECLFWPLGRDNHGYGQSARKGRFFKAHREMCTMVHGPCPGPDYQASHSCGRGHLGCVNPCHLSWKTRSENHLDRRRHGTAATSRNGQTGKVTEQVAAEIIRLRGLLTQEQISLKFGISKPTVRRIFAGKTRVARKALEAA